MKRSGKSIVKKISHVWTVDFEYRTAKGKKNAWTRAELKGANRAFRHDKSYLKEVA